MFRTANSTDPVFTETLTLDLADCGAVDSPDRSAPRAASRCRQSPKASPRRWPDEYKKATDASERYAVENRNFDLGHGDVVIAAITSCTNTSNPSVLIGAGLLARKAAAKGLTAKPWVKTSLAPGSQVVAEYLAQFRAATRSRQGRLQPDRFRLHHLHRQFRAAAGRDFEVDQRQRHHRRRRAVG